MSDLEFISSDEEGETPTPSLAAESVVKNVKGDKGNGGKNKAKAKKAAESSDDEESGDEFGNDFDFSGLQVSSQLYGHVSMR